MSTINYDPVTHGLLRRASLLPLQLLDLPPMNHPTTTTAAATAEVIRSLSRLEPSPVLRLVVRLFFSWLVLFSISADDEVVSIRPTARASATAPFLLLLPLSRAQSTLLTPASPTLGPPRRALVSWPVTTASRARPSALISHLPMELTPAW
jgi:hypothetical protein